MQREEPPSDFAWIGGFSAEDPCAGFVGVCVETGDDFLPVLVLDFAVKHGDALVIVDFGFIVDVVWFDDVFGFA